MLIRVIKSNNKHDMIKASMLDRYIISGKIKKFYRSDGWAVIGRDPIRAKDLRYAGQERRRF